VRDNRLGMCSMKFISLSLFVFSLVAVACTHKVTTTTSKATAYSEDLSSLRPTVKEYKSPEPFQLAPRDSVMRRPELDVTGKVNILIDSMTVLNRNTQYSRLTILVANSNSRETAEQARLDVFRILPGSKPTLDFVAPTYRVKVGSYFSELEAYQTLQKLKDQFPNAIIVPEPVYFK
jgi:hypothetical protein